MYIADMAGILSGCGVGRQVLLAWELQYTPSVALKSKKRNKALLENKTYGYQKGQKMGRGVGGGMDWGFGTGICTRMDME